MVGADLAAVQLRLHLALQHPQMLRIVCDHLNEYSRVQKRLLVPVRKRQHCRHILQVALRFHHILHVPGISRLQTVRLIRILQYLFLLCRRNAARIDVHGYARLFTQPVQKGLFRGRSRISPHRPHAPVCISADEPVRFKPQHGRRGKVQKFLDRRFLRRTVRRFSVRLHTRPFHPPLAVKIVIVFACEVLYKIYCHQPLHIVQVRAPNIEALVPDELFHTCQIRILLFFPHILQPHRQHKFPRGRGLKLYATQVRLIFFQQIRNVRVFFFSDAGLQIPCIVGKAFPRIEAQDLQLRLAFEQRHQRPDPRRESVLRQYGDARRAQQEKGCLPAPVCEQAVWRDSLRVDHPARPLPHHLLFYCFHSVSLSPSQLNSRGVKKYAPALCKKSRMDCPSKRTVRNAYPAAHSSGAAVPNCAAQNTPARHSAPMAARSFSCQSHIVARAVRSCG